MRPAVPSLRNLVSLLAFVAFAVTAHAATDKKDEASKEAKKPETKWSSETFSGLKFRSIGPAVTSGRISDLVVDPDDPATWFVAAASGGVWKTTNAGTTWEPIFDGEASYSIGCITLDPNDSNVVWVGSGENNSQRSVGYGDGVYKSEDGGKSWENVGLKKSEHIGKILIDPRDSNVVWVAAQGPLWNSGGDRGLYKTTDGGKTWNAVLTISEHTGDLRHRLRPARPRRRLRHRLPAPAARLDTDRRRSRGRHPQDDRRRQDLEEDQQRPAQGRHRPHRARHLAAGSGRGLRHGRRGEQEGRQLPFRKPRRQLDADGRLHVRRRAVLPGDLRRPAPVRPPLFDGHLPQGVATTAARPGATWARSTSTSTIT